LRGSEFSYAQRWIRFLVQEGDTIADTSTLAIQDARSILFGCRDAFANIVNTLHKSNSAEQNGTRRFSKCLNLLWAHKGPRTELLKRRLESLKSSLRLCLQVLPFAKDKARVANWYNLLFSECSALITLAEHGSGRAEKRHRKCS
jgi:hypothetical protein